MHVKTYLREVVKVAESIDADTIEQLARELVALRERGGRLFLLGVGGSAGNCSHAVNDFRKLCGIEAYAPTDNVAELTAIANDEGWEWIFHHWLNESNLSPRDALFVLSVGGGTDSVSLPLKHAIDLAQKNGMRVFGIVGRDGGYTKKVGDHVILIPVVNSERVTPHTESFQSVLLHLIVSHPDLQINKTKW